MGDLYFHVGGTITGHDLRRLERVLPEIDGHETLTIVMEASDSVQADALTVLLDREEFDHYPKGGHYDGFTIIARRKH
ncbi:hypothetical protein [Effusibacillus pohliae]|uniref:hypothetical protein n=1 Tax=Effusibacillus pohliae TaxID=232270 RepID=UPI00036029F8|nr:hypothetical protein [Effusibacillus pohliae]